MVFLNTPGVERQKSNFDALPKGWYRVMISDASGKDTRAGNGRYLSMCFDVIEGEFKGRKVWNNFNIQNPNEETVARALSDLKVLAEALGHPEPFQYENEYLKFVQDKVVRIKLGQRKDKLSGEIKNTVQDYIPDGDEQPAEGGHDIDSVPF